MSEANWRVDDQLAEEPYGKVSEGQLPYDDESTAAASRPEQADVITIDPATRDNGAMRRSPAGHATNGERTMLLENRLVTVETVQLPDTEEVQDDVQIGPSKDAVTAEAASDRANLRIVVGEQGAEAEHEEVIVREFWRLFGDRVDPMVRQVHGFQLSGNDVPEDIRMRKFMIASSGRHIAVGKPVPTRVSDQYADTPGVVLASAGSMNIDRMAVYRRMPYENILKVLGDRPSPEALAQLATAMRACPDIDRRTSLRLTRTVGGEYEYDIPGLDADRLRFIQGAAAEAKDRPYNARMKAGPYYEDFNGILTKVDQRLAELTALYGVPLTTENLMPTSYQSIDAKKLETALTKRGGASSLHELIYDRKAMISQLAYGKIDLSDQTIPADLFTEPGFMRMGNDAQACFNACFRMIFADITGMNLSEYEVSMAVDKIHGTTLVHDEEYLKILGSDAVAEKSGKTVQSVEFYGADLDYVSKLASIIKNKRPDADVYAIVSLGTETAVDSDIWHTNILLGATENTVLTHDPTTNIRGGANRPIAKSEFTRRWATTFNRGHVVFALPKNKAA